MAYNVLFEPPWIVICPEMDLMHRTIILRKKGLHILVRNAVVEKVGSIGKLNRSPQISQRPLISLADLLLRDIMPPYFHTESNPVYIDRNIFRGDKIEIDPIAHTLGKLSDITVSMVKVSTTFNIFKRRNSATKAAK